jgi:hypothetical protein
MPDGQKPPREPGDRDAFAFWIIVLVLIVLVVVGYVVWGARISSPLARHHRISSGRSVRDEQ